jgi:hypothetical protein
MTCKFCVGCSLPCVSGVNSSNLKQRIVRIMTQESTEKLSLCRRLLITSLSVASVAGPIVFGVIRSPQVNAQPLITSSDSNTTLRLVSLKRSHSESRETLFRTGPTTFTVTNATIKNIIANATM